MSVPFNIHTYQPSRLHCAKHGDMPEVVFQGTGGDTVVVKVGDHSAIIKEQELWAAAQLFPPRTVTRPRI